MFGFKRTSSAKPPIVSEPVKKSLSIKTIFFFLILGISALVNLISVMYIALEAFTPFKLSAIYIIIFLMFVMIVILIISFVLFLTMEGGFALKRIKAKMSGVPLIIRRTPGGKAEVNQAKHIFDNYWRLSGGAGIISIAEDSMFTVDGVETGVVDSRFGVVMPFPLLKSAQYLINTLGFDNVNEAQMYYDLCVEYLPTQGKELTTELMFNDIQKTLREQIRTLKTADLDNEQREAYMESIKHLKSYFDILLKAKHIGVKPKNVMEINLVYETFRFQDIINMVKYWVSVKSFEAIEIAARLAERKKDMKQEVPIWIKYAVPLGMFVLMAAIAVVIIESVMHTGHSGSVSTFSNMSKIIRM